MIERYRTNLARTEHGHSVVRLHFLAALLLCLLFTAHAAELSERWWPLQRLPRTILRIQSQPTVSLEMMLQSVAGLAAKSVNHRRGDELIWVENRNRDMTEWYRRFGVAHPEIQFLEHSDPWTLVERFAQRGQIKGYILYRLDRSRDAGNEYRPGMDCSVNVATSLAGVVDAIIVSEELEAVAQARGLNLVIDVRDKTQAWCFEKYRNQFNRQLLCTQDPRKPHARDLAIAHQAFTMYGPGEPLNASLAWLEPLSPILGWNGGDEFETTLLSSRYGHIQTATDWCMNLPVLMAGSEKLAASESDHFDPAAIDWNDQRSAVSFVQTDGDNVQWLEGNFFQSNESYWSDPARGKIPFGWSTCFAHLAQLCPPAIEYARATRTTNDCLIEWGGGYYFPDHFATVRPDRWDLLAHHARRTSALMNKTGTRIIGFNVAGLDSPDALKAYQVIAGQTDRLLGILVFQYDRYEAGAGRTFWVKDKSGVDIPVVTARYSIWEHANRPRAGSPAKIAREIRESVTKQSADAPRYDWVITHAWSYFKKVASAEDAAEELPQQTAATRGGMRGYSPVTWCVERLPSNISVVRPDELLWRIRMKHAPAETKKVMKIWAQHEH